MAKKKTIKKAKVASDSTSIRAGGDYVGGSKITPGGDYAGRDIIKTTTTGLKGDELARLFEQVLTSVKQHAPTEKQAEAAQKVAELQEQVKAKQPNIGLVGKTLKWLKNNVPGVSSMLSTVLSQPIIGQGIKDIAAVILEDDED